MLEVDVWSSKDGVLVLHHDDNLMRIYGHPGRISELSWRELQPLRAIKGGYGLMKLEEVAARCKGKVRLMIDRKPPQPTREYYLELARILQKYDLLTDSYFIDKQALPYFWGKARFGFRLSELPRIKEMIQKGEDVASHYFLFDHGNVLSSDAIRWCQQYSIAVVPSINIFHYRYENHRHGAHRDIAFLKACGVREFQIDSDYDDWLNSPNN
jgi:glycerophosphoryl diester phosphodiesterase